MQGDRAEGSAHTPQGRSDTGWRSRWRRAREPWLARDADLGALSEVFFVSGVVTVLVTRFYLVLTGFPQLGGAGLHIAHLLWGGLLMLVALVLLLAFLGRSMQRVAALLGGAGFGLLIDEVGKFVTSSNDYFFQPAVAIIYLVFVSLFLTFRTIERRTRFTQRELLANAYDEAVEVVLHPDDAAHRARTLRLLRTSGATGPLAQALERALVELEPAAGPRAVRTSIWRRARLAMMRAVAQVVAWRWFPRALVLLVVAYVFVFVLLFGLELLAATAFAASAGPLFPLEFFALRGHRVIQIGLLTSSVVAAALVVMGLAALPRARVIALQWFKRSTLVFLFYGQIFLFYIQQLGALVELILSLIALVGVDALLAAERRTSRVGQRKEGDPPATEASADGQHSPTPQAEGATSAH